MREIEESEDGCQWMKTVKLMLCEKAENRQADGKLTASVVDRDVVDASDLEIQRPRSCILELSLNLHVNFIAISTFVLNLDIILHYSSL